MADRGVLFTGGEGPARARIEEALESARFVIAADSGWDLAREMGVTPDLVVGDMDSIRERHILDALPRERVRVFDPEKDETDTEIGLRLLFERGATDVTLVGGGGGRLDHLIGILATFDRDVRPTRWVTRTDEVRSVEGSFRIDGVRNQTLSFFPVGAGPWRMRSSGLRWPLDALAWIRGDVGISNYGIDDRVNVEMITGRLIMVRSIAEGGDGRAFGI